MIFRNRTVVLLTGLMVIVSFSIALLSILITHKYVRENTYTRLSDIVDREKNAVLVLLNKYHAGEKEIINHMLFVRDNNISIGKQGEITFVKMKNDSIRLLIYDTLKYKNVRLLKDLPVSTPMYLSLQGKRGHLKGTDSEGIKVIAAYTFVKELNWGIIAKIPTSEINKPFISAALLVFVLSLILISLCTYAFLRITNPLIESILIYDDKILAINKDLNKKIEDLKRVSIKLEENKKELIIKHEEYEAINRELKETNEKLTKAHEIAIESESSLKELIATKDKLLSIIAHDIRSPLSGIIAYLELLGDDCRESKDSESHELIEIIISSAKNTLGLLDSLLHWAKSQSGSMNFNPQNLSLRPVINEIIDNITSTAKLKQIIISNLVSDDITVFADLNMLMTILRNLIVNAIKFTKTGGKVEIHAFLNHNNTKITIIDNGIGINKESLNKLFGIDSSEDIGSGLGLILCKEFIEKHKGEITAESEIGSGSRFVFTLPFCLERT
jgi:signal transduction histidine kinase